MPSFTQSPALPGISAEQMGKIQYGFNASRPSEDALLEDIRVLKTQPLQAQSQAASSTCAYDNIQAALQHAAVVITTSWLHGLRHAGHVCR